MARKEAPMRIGMITQELNVIRFKGWTDTELGYVVSGDAYNIGVTLAKKLFDKGIGVAEWHCIIHDKDTHSVWSEQLKSYVVQPKLRHFHFAFQLYVNKQEKIYGAMLSKIADTVGIESQYIEKGGRGSYAWDNMLSYLCHIKYTDKHQYPCTSVMSGGLSKDGVPLYRMYTEIYAERRADWERGRASVTVKRASADIDMLEEQILLGSITRNQVLLTDAFYEVYARNKRRCDDAFATYQERKIAKTIAAMEAGQFRLSVFYITGRSHSGKSRFTDVLVKSMQKRAMEELGQHWTVCSCAASNPVDDYDGSEILVMDDLRGAAMTASDWLKLLDPDRVNVSSARYRNKRVACRVVIINSERDVLDFFYYVKGSGGGNRAESIDQFFRRILAHVCVYRVPDDVDTRRVVIGEMQETAPYHVKEPSGRYSNGSSSIMTLHHDFSANKCDMSYEDAILRLTDLTISRNMGIEQ